MIPLDIPAPSECTVRAAPASTRGAKDSRYDNISRMLPPNNIHMDGFLGIGGNSSNVNRSNPLNHGSRNGRETSNAIKVQDAYAVSAHQAAPYGPRFRQRVHSHYQALTAASASNWRARLFLSVLPTSPLLCAVRPNTVLTTQASVHRQPVPKIMVRLNTLLTKRSSSKLWCPIISVYQSKSLIR